MFVEKMHKMCFEILKQLSGFLKRCCQVCFLVNTVTSNVQQTIAAYTLLSVNALTLNYSHSVCVVKVSKKMYNPDVRHNVRSFVQFKDYTPVSFTVFIRRNGVDLWGGS